MSNYIMVSLAKKGVPNKGTYMQMKIAPSFSTVQITNAATNVVQITKAATSAA